jgi:hypothetical protein
MMWAAAVVANQNYLGQLALDNNIPLLIYLQPLFLVFSNAIYWNMDFY